MAGRVAGDHRPPSGIELFPDVVAQLDGEGSRVPGAGGSTTWSGLAEDGDYATLTFIGGQMIGTVAVDGVVYDISPVSGATHLITEEGRQVPDEAPPVEGGAAPGGEGGGVAPSAPSETAPPETAPVVDVLIWYDTPARTFFGSDTAAQAELAATVNEANAAYGRSGANLTMRPVGIEYVAYTGRGASGFELDALAGNGDGVLDSVHRRRNALGADLVSLVTRLTDACGAGLEAPDDGFSVVGAECARGNYSFAHETGHNMGAGHLAEDGGGVFAYSNAYRDIDHDFRTIMAYDSSSCPDLSCTRVGYFSGPTALYNGLPVGSGGEDNARTINELASSVAAYRVPPPANDRFAAPRRLIGASGTVVGTNAGATKETGEPRHGGVPGGRSVWYRWDAPRSGRVTFVTCRSTFDTTLAAYRGSAVNALTLLAQADDRGCGGAKTSTISFNVTGGRTYRIAVDGYRGDSGTVRLAWNLPR